MNAKDCFDAEQLIDYIDGKLTEAETQKIINHLAKCERCARNLKTLNHLDEILNMKDKNFIAAIYDDLEKHDRCISYELLYQYLEGRVTDYFKARTIEKHLDSCPACLNELASLVKNSITPATESEKLEITRLRTITPEEQVSKILDYCDQPPPKKRIIGKVAAILKDRVKRFFEKLINTRYVWRPAIAFGVLIALLVGINRGARYYNTTYQIVQAEKLLLKNYRSFIGTARLSGGYSPSGISTLLGPKDEKRSYLEKATSSLNKAIRNNSESIKARQLLAHKYIIENQNDEADSIFTLIEAENSQSAALLNDYGVLYFQKKDWKKAMLHFQAALAIDQGFVEAYYNLALAKKALREWDGAILFLNSYLEREQHEMWRNAAQHLIADIMREKQELK